MHGLHLHKVVCVFQNADGITCKDPDSRASQHHNTRMSNPAASAKTQEHPERCLTWVREPRALAVLWHEQPCAVPWHRVVSALSCQVILIPIVKSLPFAGL